MSDLKFKCPNCGYHRLTEVMANVTVSTELENLYINDPMVAEPEYGDNERHGGGYILRFQCSNCKWVFRKDGENNPITSYADLAIWLKKRKMVTDDWEEAE